MTIDRKTFLSSAAGALGAAALPTAARAQFTTRFAQPLTIAVNVPLSRERAAAGQEILAGVQAAVDEVNRTAGVMGSAFLAKPFDDMDALAQSMVNVQFAASDPTVLAIIGGFDGALIVPSLQTYADAQMPLLVPGSTTDAITERGYRNVWRLPTKDSTEGALAAQFVARRVQPKLAIAVTQDGDYGSDVVQGFVNQGKASKMNVDGYSFPFDRPDYAAAAKALLSRSPDFIYLCGTSTSLGPVIGALRTGGYRGKFGASQGFYNNATLTSYAEAFDGGVISTSMPPLERAPDFANMLANFRARYAVTSLSAFAYASAQIIMTAARRTGVTNRVAMLSALQAPTSYNTIVGPFQFAFTGDSLDPLVYFYTVNGGKFKFIAPSHATSFVL